MGDASVLDVVRRMVLQHSQCRPTSEIEVRLGKIVKNRFVPGVSKEEFDKLLGELLSCKTLVGEEGWKEVVDYHYTLKESRVRTRVTFDSQTMTVQTDHVCKEQRSDLVLSLETDRECAFKIAVSNEIPVTSTPTMCVPTTVRIKQRKIFRDVREGKTVWSYELSKTWSACSRSAVEHAQMLNPPTYEVECELVDEEGAYLDSHSDTHVAKSFLLKSQLLLGEEGGEFGLVKMRGHLPVRDRKRKIDGLSSKWEHGVSEGGERDDDRHQ